jgi:hypothetical protein
MCQEDATHKRGASVSTFYKGKWGPEDCDGS